MILKYMKQLKVEEAEILRAARRKIAGLDKLQDARYFCKAAENYKNSKKSRNLPVPLNFVLGKFLKPQYEIVKTKEEYGFRRTSREVTIEAKRLNLVLGQTNNWPGTTLAIEQYGTPVFLFGPFYNQKPREDPLYAKADGVINELASFFNNRREIYTSIYAVLNAEAEKISASLGQEFFEGLKDLFSVQSEATEKLDFSVMPLAMEKHMWPEEAKETKALFIQKSMLYPPGRCGSDWFSPDVASTVWLNPKNQLIIDTAMICKGASWNHSNIAEVAMETPFLEFVNNEIGELLKQTVAMANFGTKIYEKVKTKILLENI